MPVVVVPEGQRDQRAIDDVDHSGRTPWIA